MKCNKCNADVMVLFKTDDIEVCIECYEPPRDKIVDSVINKYYERAKIGYAKYKTNLERNDLNVMEWLNHLQDELMDASLYVEKLKHEYENSTLNQRIHPFVTNSKASTMEAD